MSNIIIKRDDNPNTEDVLTALANTVFYEDGAPWQATASQSKALLRIFGEGPGPDGDAVDDFITTAIEGR